MPTLQAVRPNPGTAGEVGPGTSHPPGTSGSAISADSGRAGRSRQTTLHHHHHPLQGIGAGNTPACQHASMHLWVTFGFGRHRARYGPSGLVQWRCGIGFGRVQFETLFKTNATAALDHAGWTITSASRVRSKSDTRRLLGANICLDGMADPPLRLATFISILRTTFLRTPFFLLLRRRRA